MSIISENKIFQFWVKKQSLDIPKSDWYLLEQLIITYGKTFRVGAKARTSRILQITNPLNARPLYGSSNCAVHGNKLEQGPLFGQGMPSPPWYPWHWSHASDIAAVCTALWRFGPRFEPITFTTASSCAKFSSYSRSLGLLTWRFNKNNILLKQQ